MTGLRRRTGIGLGLGAVAVAAVASLPLVQGGPTFVDRVSFVNRGEFDVNVEVRGHDERWMSVTTAEKGSTSVAQEILDQGDTWVFRFAAQGRDGGELRLARADLRKAGWVVEVPGAALDQLRASGAPPTP